MARRRGIASVRPIVIVGGFGAVLWAVYVALALPPPETDDAWFKSPAAHLAVTGQLASPGITGFFPNVHEVFAAYPPLPGWLLGGLFALFGVTPRTAVAYSMGVHVLSALALTAVAQRTLEGWEMPDWVRWTATVSVGLAWLPGDRLLDRPEEIGLLFVWADVLWRGPPHPLGRAAISGVAAGTAALCAPFSGLLGGLSLALRALAASRVSHPGSWSGTIAAATLPIATGAATSIAIFLCWVGWLEVVHPGEFQAQFLGAMHAAEEMMPYPADFQTFRTAVAQSLMTQATLVPAFLFAAAWFPIAIQRLRPVAGGEAYAARACAVAIYVSAMVGLLLGIGRRPWAYTYFWASAEVFFACLPLVLAAVLTDKDNPMLGRVVSVVILVIAWCGPAQTLGWYVLEAPEARQDGATAELHRLIPPGECVQTTTRHWMAFEGRNPWRDAIFLSKRNVSALDDCDWLVTRAGGGASLPPYIDEFELLAEQPARAPDSHTFAWSVYRRR
jgi:hypothetical protein